MKLKRPLQKYPLIEILWDDATHIEMGWKTKEEFDKEPDQDEIVLSVGFLIKQTPSHLYIAMDIDKEGQHNQRAKIPAAMVKKIKILRKADQDNGPVA